MTRNLTCIICPKGCSLSLNVDGENLNVSGFGCLRRKKICGRRVFSVRREPSASTVRVVNRKDLMLSVKTSNPIPKEKIFEVMAKIRSSSVKAPVSIGDVILKDVYGADMNRDEEYQIIR